MGEDDEELDPFTFLYQDLIGRFSHTSELTKTLHDILCKECVLDPRAMQTEFDDSGMKKIKNSQTAELLMGHFTRFKAVAELIQARLLEILAAIAANLETIPAPARTWLDCDADDEDQQPRPVPENPSDLEAAILSTIDTVVWMTEELREDVAGKAIRFNDRLDGTHSWLVIFRHLQSVCESALSRVRNMLEEIGSCNGFALCSKLAAILKAGARRRYSEAMPLAKRRRLADGSAAEGGPSVEDGSSAAGGGRAASGVSDQQRPAVAGSIHKKADLKGGHVDVDGFLNR